MASRNLTHHPVGDGRNSLRHWTKFVSPLRVAYNFVIIYVCRFVPSMALKAFFYKLVGIKVGKNVSVGLMAMMDIFFPQLITLEDNCIIGYNSVLLAHEFLVEELVTGPVVIGKSAMIGANCTVLAGVKVGERAKVSAASLVNKDIPAGVLAGGVPVTVLKEGQP